MDRLLLALMVLAICAVSSSAQIIKTINYYQLTPPSALPAFIAPGPDSALWFDTYGSVNDIDRITTSGVISVVGNFGNGSPGGPGGITTGSDGAVWFLDPNSNSVWRIDTSGTMTSYQVPTQNSLPIEIAAGPDGALWFTEADGGKIGRIDTSGAITEYLVPTSNPQLLGITTGPDGALWFTENIEGSPKIGRITTSGIITEFTIPNENFAFYITSGPDGALWFSGWSNIYRITTSGQITRYSEVSGEPLVITPGPDGALWFGENYSNKIGRITTAGAITEFSVVSYFSGSITAGPDGALWFRSSNKTGEQGAIGQAVLSLSDLKLRKRYLARPIPMGISVSNTPSSGAARYAGTAGLLVHSTSDSSLKFILSNNHVLGAVGPTDCPNTAKSGKTWTLEPGTLDIGKDPGQDYFWRVGTAAKFYPLKKNSDNLIDAAISRTDLSRSMTSIFGIGQPNAAIGKAKAQEKVVKSGRTTGVTHGTVTSVNVKVPVAYEGCGTYQFVKQVSIIGSGFSGAGDSGSAILDSTTLTPVGLLFAGSTKATFANPIAAVFSLLKVFPETPPGFALTPEGKAGSRGESLEEASDPQLVRLEVIQSRHDDQLLRISGVQAVGIGLAEDSRELAFHVYVIKRTLELERMIPQEVEGVPVRLLETGGEIRPL